MRRRERARDHKPAKSQNHFNTQTKDNNPRSRNPAKPSHKQKHNKMKSFCQPNSRTPEKLAHYIQDISLENTAEKTNPNPNQANNTKRPQHQQSKSRNASQPHYKQSNANARKDKTRNKIEEIRQRREQRRAKMKNELKKKKEKRMINQQQGHNVDVDYEMMIEKEKFKEHLLEHHTDSRNLKLSVCVRKRPLFEKEKGDGEIDAVSCANPQLKVHFPKVKVDGITKYIENYVFTFDNTFNESEQTEDVYKHSLKGLLPDLMRNSYVTVFAYGQTGSGKTYTMKGVTDSAVRDLFGMRSHSYQFYMSFYEIYGGRCFDLLNNNKKVTILEDGNNNVQIQGLTQREASTPHEMHRIIDYGHKARTTHSTSANDTSSRSHAICQITIHKSGEFRGKLILCDLAGSERAQDCQSNSRKRRIEGAEINKSLLALKECIRAMHQKNGHVPFRASKLTLALRDSFTTSKVNSKIVMIACVCPGSKSSDHTINTLRYADRLKTKQNRQIDPNKAIYLKKCLGSVKESLEFTGSGNQGSIGSGGGNGANLGSGGYQEAEHVFSSDNLEKNFFSTKDNNSGGNWGKLKVVDNYSSHKVILGPGGPIKESRRVNKVSRLNQMRSARAVLHIKNGADFEDSYSEEEDNLYESISPTRKSKPLTVLTDSKHKKNWYKEDGEKALEAGIGVPAKLRNTHCQVYGTSSKRNRSPSITADLHEDKSIDPGSSGVRQKASKSRKRLGVYSEKRLKRLHQKTSRVSNAEDKSRLRKRKSKVKNNQNSVHVVPSGKASFISTKKGSPKARDGKQSIFRDQRKEKDQPRDSIKNSLKPSHLGNNSNNNGGYGGGAGETYQKIMKERAKHGTKGFLSPPHKQGAGSPPGHQRNVSKRHIRVVTQNNPKKKAKIGRKTATGVKKIQQNQANKAYHKENVSGKPHHPAVPSTQVHSERVSVEVSKGPRQCGRNQIQIQQQAMQGGPKVEKMKLGSNPLTWNSFANSLRKMQIESGLVTAVNVYPLQESELIRVVEPDGLGGSSSESRVMYKSYKKRRKRDVDILKTSVRMEKNNLSGLCVANDEIFTYQEKIDDLNERHDDLLDFHMKVLREDTKFLADETAIYITAQNSTLGENLDNYIDNLSTIIDRKMLVYSRLREKINLFRKAMAEEELFHSKIVGSKNI